MIAHELILLGLLKESPKHGYEIKKAVHGIFSLLAGIDLKSIYYPLTVLEKSGLVEKRSDKAGKRPVRYVYGLTAKGKARFADLLSKSFLDFTRPQFSLDLSLYFLRYMDPAAAKRRLRARIYILNQLTKSVGQMMGRFGKKQNTSLACILRHNLEMLETESRFLAQLIKTL